MTIKENSIEENMVAEGRNTPDSAVSDLVTAMSGLSVSGHLKTVPASFDASLLASKQIINEGKLQKVLLKMFLANMVFGSKEDLHPSTHTDFDWLLVKTTMKFSHQKIDIVLGQDALKGSIFFKPEQGKLNTSVPVAIIFTGSFAPSESYAPPMIEAYLNKGFTVVAVDPIGFGQSGGDARPTPENFLKSAEAVALFVRSEVQADNTKVVLHGYSLGGFAAAHVAALHENQGMNVVLDRAGSSAAEIAEVTQGRLTSKLAGKITGMCVPYDLRTTLPNITGYVLSVQADLDRDSDQNTLPNLAHTLITSMIQEDPSLGKHLQTTAQQGLHITTYGGSWTQAASSAAHIAWSKWLTERGF